MAAVAHEWQRLKVNVFKRDNGLEQILDALGYDVVIRDSERTDIYMFGGGPDISPLLYGERALRSTVTDLRRDMEEISYLKKLDPYAKKVGICRGAQLLSVLSGATLYQHVTGHLKPHKVLASFDGKEMEEFEVTSTHHQVISLPPDEYSANELACANEATFVAGDGFKWKLDDEPGFKETEAAYFWATNSLCIQWHPEYARDHKQRQVTWFDEAIQEYFAPRKKGDN